MAQTQILSIRQLTERHPGFTEPSLRWLVFNARGNGLLASGAIVRIGRRVLIDEVKFLAWVENHAARAA